MALAVALGVGRPSTPSATHKGERVDPTIARAASQALGVFTQPKPLADDTGLVRTTVLASGDLKVIQWIHTSRPMSTLRVTVPPVLGLDEGDVTVSHLFAGGDGSVVHTQRVAGPRASWRGDLFGAHSADVSYDPSGVVTPTLGGPAGPRPGSPPSTSRSGRRWCGRRGS